MGDVPDVIYSDKLNHASIIDSIRLARQIRKSTVARPYNHMDVDHLRTMLEEDKSKGFRLKFIVTDGVFSMEGDIAPLDKLVDLARTYGALLVVDESHATGVNGKTGRGTPEHFGVDGHVDIITGTFGKALGGACGGFVTSRKEVCELLRQKGRPYTFSNSLPPMVCGATLAAFERLDRDGAALMAKLHGNADRFREGVKAAGFEVHPSKHAIVPVMIRDTAKTMAFAKDLANDGVYAKGLWYPVVERGAERIRVQISAAHTTAQMDAAVAAFKAVGRRTNVLN
jgi:glycine C-acetyltransferase